MRFRRKTDIVEWRFNNALNLVRDLDKSEFNRFMKGLELAWQGYDTIRKTKTIEEKEIRDITEAEKILEEEA